MPPPWGPTPSSHWIGSCLRGRDPRALDFLCLPGGSQFYWRADWSKTAIGTAGSHRMSAFTHPRLSRPLALSPTAEQPPFLPSALSPPCPGSVQSSVAHASTSAPVDRQQTIPSRERAPLGRNTAPALPACKSGGRQMGSHTRPPASSKFNSLHMHTPRTGPFRLHPADQPTTDPAHRP